MPEAVLFALERNVGVVDPALGQRGDHGLRLIGRHDPVFQTLKEDDRARELLRVVDRRASAVALDRLGIRTHEFVQIARLKLVCVAHQRFEITDPVVARTGREGVVEGQCTERRVATGAASADGEPPAIHPTLLGKRARRRDAVRYIDDAPSARQSLAVLPAVAGRAAVVHVDHRDAPAGPVLDAQAEGRAGSGGGTAVALHQQGRPLARRCLRISVARRIEERVGRSPILGCELEGFRPGPAGLVHVERAERLTRSDEGQLALLEREVVHTARFVRPRAPEATSMRWRPAGRCSPTRTANRRCATRRAPA